MALTSPLATLEARIQWATKKREVYTFEDTTELNVSVPKISTDDDDDEIGDIQKKYERRYRIKKEEKFQEEERKKDLEKRLEAERKRKLEKQLEAERKRQEEEKISTERERLKNLREQLEPTLGSISEMSQKRKRDAESDDITGALPMKIAQSAVKTRRKHGHRYNPPCDQCEDNDISCHKQVPVQTSCYACKQAGFNCSFFKKPPQGSRIKWDSSSEEEALPTSIALRRSARINADIITTEILQSLNDKVGTLISEVEALHATIRDGFCGFQKMSDRMGEDSLRDTTPASSARHIVTLNTPDESPSCSKSSKVVSERPKMLLWDN